jgi:tripartite-type tricarboxylate transporter receptor subunit TctC
MLRGFAFVGLALTALAAPVQAADFYQGKQVTIIVGFSPGGGYDLTARLFARHLGRHLAGNPTVIVSNMAPAVRSRPLRCSAPRRRTARASA